jgi:hypothetical protein
MDEFRLFCLNSSVKVTENLAIGQQGKSGTAGIVTVK